MGNLHRLKIKLVAYISVITFVTLLTVFIGWSSVNGAPPSAVQATCGPYHFADAGTARDSSYTGATFHLSQNYPTRLPTNQAKPWKNFDFRTQPEKYLKSILSYVLAGNVQADFQGDHNSVRTWYHAPWLIGGSYASREYVRGLTRERSSSLGELLNTTQTAMVSNYAVSMYNRLGGYTIGKVWCNPTNPNAAAARFPDGAVAFKLLFTTATVTQVPYLDGTLERQAFVQLSGSGAQPHVQTVRLLQLDVAVRDQRANNTTGWVFGTFVYDGTQTGSTVWDRLVPIGLMWGNDPTFTTVDLQAGQKPVETIILNDTIGGISLKLGWNRRLNGPVDNPVSSCLSCHSTAQDTFIRIGDAVPHGTTDASRLPFFRNIAAPTPFATHQTSLDYSLQLAYGIDKCIDAHVCATRTPVP